MNMIISKKHIILATLVMALCVAVYLNYRFNQTGGELLATNVVEESKSYGEAQFVDGAAAGPEAQESEAYFAEAKLTRSKSRDEAVEAMKTMLQDSALSADEKAQLTMKAAQIAESIETEGKMENLIKAKGFSDCMVYFDDEKVDIVVKTEGLQESEVAQIRDIVVSETAAPLENISIIEVK